MPQYQITAPDGSSWTVTAPEGATQDQVLAYAQANWKPKKEAPPIAGFKPPEQETDLLSVQNNPLLIGAGKTFTRIGQGMQQLFAGGDEAAKLKAQVEEENRLYKPLQEARQFATGIGEALPSMAIPAGGASTLLGNAARMAVGGALPGLLEYGSAGERGARGAAGAVAGALMPVAGAALKTAKSFVEPLYNAGRQTIAGRTLNRVAGDSADTIAQRMAGAQPLVPGSLPTAGQVAESGGIAALERAAASSNPEAYTQRAMEQSSARLNALRGIAGDEASMAAAQANRQAAKQAAYAQADVGVAPLDDFFAGLVQRPQFAEAVQRAQELARNKGLADIFFRNDQGQPVALIGQGAHFIKKALDEAGEFGSKSYTGKAAAGAANDTNTLFQQWLDKSIPEYAAGKAAYAAKSVPINQMQVGQSLLDAVSPALADYGALGRETAATYARALRNADVTAAKATGFPGTKMANVMTPQQMSTIENVAKDLARKANAQDLGRGVGSDTFQKLAMQNIAEQSGMPRLMGGLLGLPGVSRATQWAYRDTDEKVQRLLADALLNPQRAAELMRNAAPKDRALLQRLLGQSTLRAGLLGAPAAQEAIAP